MSRKKQMFTNLVTMTETAYSAKRAKMAALVRQEQELADRMRELEQMRRSAAVAPIDNATMVGADLRWKAWIEREKLRTNRQIASLRAQRIRMRKEVATLFGRFHAASSLRDRIDP